MAQENPQGRVLPGHFSWLFNVAASQPAQITTCGTCRKTPPASRHWAQAGL